MVGQVNACIALYETIRRKWRNGKVVVSWECNALNLHEVGFITSKAADAFAEKLKAVSLAFNCGEITVELAT